MICQKFKRNRDGTDWVVGDLHGCFGQLQQRLDSLQFDPARDRLFSVGDLIDRGPDSAAVLEWLDHPWFHPCRGNHEAILLTAMLDPHSEAMWVDYNGGEWWLDQDDVTRAAIAQACREMPYALEVTTAWGTVGIVHADVPPRTPWPDFIARLERGDTRSKHTALWSRRRLARDRDTPIAGIDRVVCGHSILENGRIKVLGNVWHIDTGGFLHDQNPRYGLTVLPLEHLFQKKGRGE